MADPQAVIDKRAAPDNTFIRSDFALEKLSEQKKLNPDAPLAELYFIVFEGKSPHQKSEAIQNKIDNFFWDQFKANNLDGFTSKVLKKAGLSAEVLQKHTFVQVDDGVVNLEHRTVLEFHCARFLMYTKDVTVFKIGVESLYNLDKLDKNMMVRKFLTGLTHLKDCPDAKQALIVKKMVDKLQIFMSNNLLREYKGPMLKKAVRLQSMLKYDVMEFDEPNLAFFKKNFLAVPLNLRIEVDMSDTSTELPAVIYFMKNLPESKFVNIILNLENTPLDDFAQLVAVIMKLKKNMTYMQITNIEFDPSHVELFNELMGKVNTSMILRYNDGIDIPLDDLQTAIDSFSGLRMFISYSHRGKYGLVRNKAYTSAGASLIPISHFGGRHLTINLSKYLAKDEATTKQQIKLNLNVLHDFVISCPHELIALTRVLTVFPNLKIHHLSIFLSPEVTEMEVYQLVLRIIDLDHKVQVLRLKNMVGRVLDTVVIYDLMYYTCRSLTLFYAEEIEEADKNVLEEIITEYQGLLTPELFMFLKFNDSNIKILPVKGKPKKPKDEATAERQRMIKESRPKPKKNARKRVYFEDIPLPEDNIIRSAGGNVKVYPPIYEEEIIPDDETESKDYCFYLYFLIIIMIFVTVIFIP